MPAGLVARRRCRAQKVPVAMRRRVPPAAALPPDAAPSCCAPLPAIGAGCHATVPPGHTAAQRRVGWAPRAVSARARVVVDHSHVGLKLAVFTSVFIRH